MRIMISVLLTGLFSGTVSAEVTKSSADGFIIQHSAIVAQDSSNVFEKMTTGVGLWWHPDHTFSGNAGNMSVDMDCFCERWGDNLVRHLDTRMWIKDKKVIMEGGLGPLKGLGLNGTMIWALTPGEGAVTNVNWTYHVYGYSDTDLAGLAPVVDTVLKQQIERLAAHYAGEGTNKDSQ